MNKLEKAFFLVVMILLFQIFRNINLIFYVGILLLCYINLYYQYLKKVIKTNKIRKLKKIEGIFLFCYLLLPVVSLFNMEWQDYIVASLRSIVTFPFIIFCFLYRDFNLKFKKKLLILICYFMILASLSIPYQMIFGKIFFLADSSSREGLIRYSSLAGSLTSLGTLGAYSLTILLFYGESLFGKIKQWLFIILLIFGMLLSLQKAAVMNIVICFFLYIFINLKKNFIKLIITTLLFIGIIIIYKMFFSENIFYYSIDKILKYTFSKSDTGTSRDLVIRIIELPLKVIEYNNISGIDWVVGIGFKSLGGILGLSKFPMSHNNYADFIFSGGVIYLFSYLWILISLQFKILKIRLKKNLDYMCFVLILLFFINMGIGANSFYQPVTCVINFIIISFFVKIE